MADVEILYEDNHLLAVNKPAGLLTQPSGTKEDSLEARAKVWVKETRGKPGDVFLHTVHRIDKPVSGIVLFARTSKALSRMNEEMRSRNILKVYHAIVTGKLPDVKGTLMHHLKHSQMRSVVTSSSDDGSQKASLSYSVIKHIKDMYVVEIILETGRYHQIRAQLAASDCPVLGDTRYGGQAWQHKDKIALHHRKMEFMHPTLKTLLTVEAPYPVIWPIG